jgi:hypothetical protein
MYETIQIENRTINIEAQPTLVEKILFVGQVVLLTIESSALHNQKSSALYNCDGAIYTTLLDAHFDMFFLMIFTDYEFTDETKDEETGKFDVHLVHDYIRRFNLREKLKSKHEVGKLITQLETDVMQRLQFEYNRQYSNCSGKLVEETDKENRNQTTIKELVKELAKLNPIVESDDEEWVNV